jgi:hypothetical protein
MLALLLVVGLFFNRCAFEGDAFDARQSERAADRATKHVERIVSDMEVSMEEFGERMGEAGEEFGEQMGEFGESIGESFEDSGDEPEEDITVYLDDDKEADRKSETIELSITSQLDAPIEIDLALDVPAICGETALDFGRARKNALSIAAVGSDEMQSPGISSVDSETITLAFRGETPSALTLKLPRNVPYVRFEEPQQVKLALSENTLLMKLDAASVGSLKVARSKKALTIKHPDWQLTITGISQPLALMGLDGEMLGRVESNKRGEVEFDFVDENKGGAK